MNRKLIIKLICITSSLSAQAVTATTPHFSDLDLANYGQIPQNRGDNVNSLNDDTGSYSVGNDFTPNITLSYKTTDARGNLAEEWVEYWFENNDDLIGAAFPGQNMLQALNKDGTILWDFGIDIIHGTGKTHDSFFPSIAPDSEIMIHWGIG